MEFALRAASAAALLDKTWIVTPSRSRSGTRKNLKSSQTSWQAAIMCDLRLLEIILNLNLKLAERPGPPGRIVPGPTLPVPVPVADSDSESRGEANEKP